MISKRLADCQRVIGYCFANEQLLEMALTHSSVRTPDRECNERLEFLGDSVLGLAITEELYRLLPEQQEGELTRIKSAVVSRGPLYKVSMRMGLPRFVEVAKGVGRREDLPVSLTANLVESIIGAIYMDAGFFPAREFILRHLGPELEDVLADRVPRNYKSLLQQEAQQVLGATPIYRTIEEEGPDHRKCFTVAAVLRGTEYGRATGINKKEAEQEAARHALEALQRSGRGRRRREETRGDGRGESRGDGRGEGRGDGRGEARGEGRGPDARDRDAIRPLIRQEHDDDAWRAWAEREAGGSATGGGAGGAPAASMPSTPYAIGPESDEAWSDAPAARATPPPPPAPAPSRAPRAAPERPESGWPDGTFGSGLAPEADPDFETVPPSQPSAPGSSSAPAPTPSPEDDGRGRRRRRGGRGRGRGRGRAEDGEAAPADARAPGGEPGAAPAHAPVGPEADAPPEPSEPAPAATAHDAPPTSEADRGEAQPPPRGRTRRARGEPRAARAPRAPRTPAETAPQAPPAAVEAPEAKVVPAPKAPPEPKAPRAPKAPARAKAEPAPASGRGFGAGVSSADAPPPPPPPEKAVHVVGAVEAVKKAPVKKTPPPTGGFGVGL